MIKVSMPHLVEHMQEVIAPLLQIYDDTNDGSVAGN
jgi:hypothetical protein